MKAALGIDFGTTNSCVAVLQDGRVKVIPSAEGGQTTPSIVALLENGDRLVGVAAKRQALANPQRTVASVKRLLGRTPSEFTSDSDRASYDVVSVSDDALRIAIGGDQHAPEEIGGLILAKLRNDVEQALGCAIEEAVITVPAYFNEAQRQAVKTCAQIAGLNAIRLINEPTAAALAYGFDGGATEPTRLLVFDLGGGTFDVSVLEIADGVFEVLATAGDNHLGGDDFDRAIVAWLARQFEAASNVDVTGDPLAMQRLNEAAERAKIELSSAPQTDVYLPFLVARPDGPLHLQETLTRAQLLELSMPLLTRLESPVRQCLGAARLAAGEVDDVLLVGGMTRMPAVQAKVKELIGKEPLRSVNPDEAVAVGAAVQASIMLGETKEIVLLDVTPLALGVEVDGGFVEHLIPANTPIPARVAQVFTTSEDNQSSVEVRICQGDRELAASNRLLGHLQLLEIPSAPRGTPEIEVSFDLDVNGLLTVQARDLATGAERSTRIEATGALTQEEIEAMRKDTERYAVAEREARQRHDLQNEIALLRHQVNALLENDTGAFSKRAVTKVERALKTLEAVAVEAQADPVGLIAARDTMLVALRGISSAVG